MKTFLKLLFAAILLACSALLVSCGFSGNANGTTGVYPYTQQIAESKKQKLDSEFINYLEGRESLKNVNS